jgi:hypothetical protein
VNVDELFDPPEHELAPEVARLEDLRRVHGGPIGCEFARRREGLGFGPARFVIRFTSQLPREIVSWSLDVDDWLIQHGVRAIREENEAERFGFAFNERFEDVEASVGSGFFNAVFFQYLRESELAGMGPLREMMDAVHSYNPSEGWSADDSRKRIKNVLMECADALRKHLRYEKPVAVRILAGAIAYYLDERFNVSNRRFLGFR